MNGAGEGGAPSQTLVTVAALWLLVGQSNPQTFAGAQSTGTLSQYTGSEENTGPSQGSCGYGVIPTSIFPLGNVASIDSTSSLYSSLSGVGCGSCLQRTCAAGASCSPVTVHLVDVCPNCTFAVPQRVFGSLAPSSLGNVQATAKPIPCQPSTPITLRVLEFRPDQGGYAKFVLLSVAGSGGFTTMEVKPSSAPASAWTSVQNYYGAVFEASNLQPFPTDLRFKRDAQQLVIPGIFIGSMKVGDVTTSSQLQV